MFQIAQECQGVCRTGQRRRDEFQQGLGIVRSDPGVGQGRAQRGRVGCLGNAAIGPDAQAFLFQTDQPALQRPLPAAVDQVGQPYLSQPIEVF